MKRTYYEILVEMPDGTERSLEIAGRTLWTSSGGAKKALAANLKGLGRPARVKSTRMESEAEEVRALFARVKTEEETNYFGKKELIK